MLGVFSGGITRISFLEEFLEGAVTHIHHHHRNTEITAIAGWGLRPTTKKARAYAKKHNLPYIALEDGFLRSVELGSKEPPLSIVVDDLGIYYDASQPSRLESLIAAPLDDAARGRVEALAQAWQAARVSKYNHLREYTGALPARYVLVVDQTFGDCSITYGQADAHIFSQMLQAALDENPDCAVLVKIHPDVFAGKKKGHFDPAVLSAMDRVQVLAQDVHPVRLLEEAQAVYCVTSQMGFEALLWGKPVRTFGMPFYAGWGLTQDELPAPLRRQPVSLLQLVYAALIAYPRYVHPETGLSCEVESLLSWMGLQRQMRERFPAVVFALGFSRWKRPIVRDFLQGSQVRFIKDLSSVSEESTVVVWGRRKTEEVANPLQVLRLEDGFLRSVGLGADLIRPISWIVDDCGIYFDGSQSSQLEQLLMTQAANEPLSRRARNLRERIAATGLTKYNVGVGQWHRPAGAKRVILVPGQVESDASLAWGAPGLRHNDELLQAVRQVNPDAWVVYKPHPDVVAGLRAQGKGMAELMVHCNEQVVDVPMAVLLDQVDEVHTLTSLAGFEALLRGKRVVCYGLPFYAGWGLTEDKLSFPTGRRGRKLHLDDLVAGALLLYPCYLSRQTGRFTTAERALTELLAWREQGVSHMPWWRQGLRVVLSIWSRWLCR